MPTQYPAPAAPMTEDELYHFAFRPLTTSNRRSCIISHDNLLDALNDYYPSEILVALMGHNNPQFLSELYASCQSILCQHSDPAQPADTLTPENFRDLKYIHGNTIITEKNWAKLVAQTQSKSSPITRESLLSIVIKKAIVCKLLGNGYKKTFIQYHPSELLRNGYNTAELTLMGYPLHILVAALFSCRNEKSFFQLCEDSWLQTDSIETPSNPEDFFFQLYPANLALRMQDHGIELQAALTYISTLNSSNLTQATLYLCQQIVMSNQFVFPLRYPKVAAQESIEQFKAALYQLIFLPNKKGLPDQASMRRNTQRFTQSIAYTSMFKSTSLSQPYSIAKTITNLLQCGLTKQYITRIYEEYLKFWKKTLGDSLQHQALLEQTQQEAKLHITSPEENTHDAIEQIQAQLENIRQIEATVTSAIQQESEKLSERQKNLLAILLTTSKDFTQILKQMITLGRLSEVADLVNFVRLTNEEIIKDLHKKSEEILHQCSQDKSAIADQLSLIGVHTPEDVNFFFALVDELRPDGAESSLQPSARQCDLVSQYILNPSYPLLETLLDRQLALPKNPAILEDLYTGYLYGSDPTENIAIAEAASKPDTSYQYFHGLTLPQCLLYYPQLNQQFPIVFHCLMICQQIQALLDEQIQHLLPLHSEQVNTADLVKQMDRIRNKYGYQKKGKLYLISYEELMVFLLSPYHLNTSPRDIHPGYFQIADEQSNAYQIEEPIHISEKSLYTAFYLGYIQSPTLQNNPQTIFQHVLLTISAKKAPQSTAEKPSLSADSAFPIAAFFRNAFRQIRHPEETALIDFMLNFSTLLGCRIAHPELGYTLKIMQYQNSTQSIDFLALLSCRYSLLKYTVLSEYYATSLYNQFITEAMDSSAESHPKQMALFLLRYLLIPVLQTLQQYMTLLQPIPTALFIESINWSSPDIVQQISNLLKANQPNLTQAELAATLAGKIEYMRYYHRIDRKDNWVQHLQLLADNIYLIQPEALQLDNHFFFYLRYILSFCSSILNTSMFCNNPVIFEKLSSLLTQLGDRLIHSSVEAINGLYTITLEELPKCAAASTLQATRNSIDLNTETTTTKQLVTEVFATLLIHRMCFLHARIALDVDPNNHLFKLIDQVSLQQLSHLLSYAYLGPQEMEAPAEITAALSRFSSESSRPEIAQEKGMILNPEETGFTHQLALRTAAATAKQYEEIDDEGMHFSTIFFSSNHTELAFTDALNNKHYSNTFQANGTPKRDLSIKASSLYSYALSRVSDLTYPDGIFLFLVLIEKTCRKVSEGKMSPSTCFHLSKVMDMVFHLPESEYEKFEKDMNHISINMATTIKICYGRGLLGKSLPSIYSDKEFSAFAKRLANLDRLKLKEKITEHSLEQTASEKAFLACIQLMIGRQIIDNGNLFSTLAKNYPETGVANTVNQLEKYIAGISKFDAARMQKLFLVVHYLLDPIAGSKHHKANIDILKQLEPTRDNQTLLQTLYQHLETVSRSPNNHETLLCPAAFLAQPSSGPGKKAPGRVIPTLK